MPRPRKINADEVATWVAVFLDAAFDPGSQELDQHGKSQLLALVSDFTNYPDDFPSCRRAELLLMWSSVCLPDDWWPRLQARVRKRRSRG